MLLAISDFLKDTLDESLRKPLQPSSLFAAAILLLLNLLFIFPILVRRNNLIATWYLGQDPLWQIVLASTLTLVLAYVLLSFSSTILKLATGELWADSFVLGCLLTRIQERKLIALEDELEKEEDDLRELAVEVGDEPKRRKKLATREARYVQRRWDKGTRFPAEEGYVAPTALGNVMAATESYVWQRYRIDRTMLWPYLETAIAGDQALVKRIDNEKATLDFLLNMGFVLVAYSVEHVLLYLFWQKPLLQVGLVPLILLALAYLGLYRAAISKARSWGRSVQMAFDTHREELRKALGLREFRSRADERRVWKEASQWLMWGPDREKIQSAAEYPYDDKYCDQPWGVLDSIFEAPAALAMSVDSSDNVNVTVKTAVTIAKPKVEFEGVDEPREVDTTPRNKYVNYVVLVSNADTAQNAKDGDGPAAAQDVCILVSDPQVPFIKDDSLPTPEVDGYVPTGVEGKRIPAGIHKRQRHDQLWHIPSLPPNSASVLRYDLLADGFEVVANNVKLEIKATVTVKEHRIKYSFEVVAKSRVSDARLKVFDTRILPIDPATELWGNLVSPKGVLSQLDATRLGEPAYGLQWCLGKLSKNDTVTLSYAHDMSVVK